jgi:cytochrome c heme-lyase
MSAHPPSQGCPVAHEVVGSQQCASTFYSHGHAPPDPFAPQPIVSVDQHANKTVKHDAEPETEGLSTEAIPSSIPRSGTNTTWNYPSQQRFYNAMRRKGWETLPKDVPSTHSIHNLVNEQCWKIILEWEQLHEKECSHPTLDSFHGRPKDFSPKARLKHFFGYVLPFDRHDWIVDRCGKKVRYVLDFYRGPEMQGKAASIYLDIRPALDSWEAVYDRIRMFWRRNLFV